MTADAVVPGHDARRPRRRPGENRERLIAAGIAEFGTRGYHGTSTAAIAALADVPQPHVYANFSTKQQLFLSCAERTAARLEDSRGVASRRHASSSAAEESADRAQLARFVLQAVAALGDETLGEQLQHVLLRIRRSLGGQNAFDELIALGSHSLLERSPR